MGSEMCIRDSIHAVRTDDYDDEHYQATYRSRKRYLDLTPAAEAELPPRLELFDGASLGGYGKYSPADVSEALHIYGCSGIFFGPTYTYKALIGTRMMVETGIIPSSASTLLIHTGGVNELELLTEAQRQDR